MILIDIEMPETCEECPCIRGDRLKFVSMYQCNVTFQIVEKITERPKWCPLKQVQE